MLLLFNLYIYIYIIFVEKSTEIFEGFRALVLLNHKFTEHVHCKLHSLIPRVSIKGDFIGKPSILVVHYTVLICKPNVAFVKLNIKCPTTFCFKSHGVKLDLK